MELQGPNNQRLFKRLKLKNQQKKIKKEIKKLKELI